MTFTAGILATLIILLVIASVTDIREHLIYNWTTYPGIALGLALRWIEGGNAGFEDAVKGFVICGVLMLPCFVLFGLGGGDVKLFAMIGAFLGFERGVEALLWTLVLGGILGAVILVWQLGFLTIIKGVGRHLARMWKARAWVPIDTESRKPLKQPLFLAPSGLWAVLIVTHDVWARL